MLLLSIKTRQCCPKVQSPGPLNNSYVVSASIPPPYHSHRLNIHPFVSSARHASPHAGLANHHRLQPSTLDCILASPLSGCRLVSRTVGLVHVRNLGDERVVGVGVRQHRADGKEDYHLSAHVSSIMEMRNDDYLC